MPDGKPQASRQVRHLSQIKPLPQSLIPSNHLATGSKHEARFFLGGWDAEQAHITKVLDNVRSTQIDGMEKTLEEEKKEQVTLLLAYPGCLQINLNGLDHQVVLVSLEKRDYVVDVGFGAQVCQLS